MAQARREGPAIPQFTIHARTVVEEVVVRDKEGHPVPDLRKEDFHIFENSILQKISFFEQNVDAAHSAVPASPPPANTFTNLPLADAHNVTNILLLDALNSWPEDRMYAHVQMVKYLASIPAGMRLGIFTLDPKGLNLIWPINQDPSALRLAIARYTSIHHSRKDSAAAQKRALLGALESTARSAQDARVAEGALRSFLERGAINIDEFNHGVLTPFQQIADYLAGVPGRKNLFWIVGNVPWCGHSGQCGEVMDRLAQAGVSVYPIDAHGVDVDMGIGPSPAFHQAAHRFIYSETWADETGGKAYHSNDIAAEIADAVNHGSRYYTLAYVPADARDAGGERKIEVRVASNYILSYRKHYLEQTPKEIAKAVGAPASNPLLPQMGHGLPNASEITFRVTVNPSALPPASTGIHAGQNAKLAGKLRRYEIDLKLQPWRAGLETIPGGSRSVPLQVAQVLYGQGFKPLNWDIRTVHVKLPPMGQEGNIPVHLEIDAPMGDTSLRIGVYDPATSKVGTLEVPLSAVTDSRK